jgi:glucokinase
VVFGVPHLHPERDVVVLAKGEPDREGPLAVIGAGTGLGEASALETADGLRVLPSEGGHCDFAPRNDLEIELFRFLLERHSRRVSVERAVSGPGLVAIYDFVVSRALASSNPATVAELRTGDPGEVIGRLGSSGADLACARALDLFVSLYGSEAGNLALKVLPTRGLYIGGGIARKLVERMRRGDFMQALVAKGRMTDVLQRIPVSVITTPEVALIGARAVANVILNGVSSLPR